MYDTTSNLHSKLEIIDFPYLLNPVTKMHRLILLCSSLKILSYTS
jgi:hypothetical protein